PYDHGRGQPAEHAEPVHGRRRGQGWRGWPGLPGLSGYFPQRWCPALRVRYRRGPLGDLHRPADTGAHSQYSAAACPTSAVMSERFAALTALGLSSGLLLSACGEGSGLAGDPDGDGGGNADECTPGAEPPEVETADIPLVDVPESGEDDKEIEFALIPWEEGIATTNMWKVILEEKGYDVSITDLDVAPMYQGAANGDLDIFMDAWLPQTHGDYWEDYGDQLENLSVWYDNAILTLTVPEYMEDINSIPDLREHADELGNEIVGIETS